MAMRKLTIGLLTVKVFTTIKENSENVKLIGSRRSFLAETGLAKAQNACRVLEIKIIIPKVAWAESGTRPGSRPETGGSSNGRTAAFGVADGGSNPPPPASILN
jgi:hypothetical protein